ncbi:hypothetical protein A5789_27225 [Nocardia sp. 852002-51101_SCH5132738]|uniref:hypothetical protein n=1 Tax=Nocardia sp. 852002-51101_SCH5132738 TaxID=1834095 RepID=UPI0007EB7923|nr:hypothetical protein [Nocardia sp. 852002-51101_SCH5132738]OBA51631.1 hypothetical protein A5789_27225 [Nocardia sp. 852002-51101_SCH5132738]
MSGVILVCVGKSSAKTTVAMNVAAQLAMSPPTRRRASNTDEKANVLLLDADPQASASEIDDHREKPRLFDLREYPSPTIHKDLPALAEGYDHVIIDCPAGVGRRAKGIADDRIRITRSAIFAAMSDDHGVVVVPIMASLMDVWAAVSVMDVIEQARVHASAAPGAYSRAVLLIRWDARSTSVRRDADEELTDAPLPILSTTLGDRSDFRRCIKYGLSVLEYAPRSVAADEIRALTTELLTIAGERKNKNR